jgi:DNA-directed RNA polymerase II subunit RPB1
MIYIFNLKNKILILYIENMTHLLHELQNADNLESVHEIQFSLFSHQDIKRGSVADILTPDTYDSNIPKNNGLFDHNMGSIDASIICPIDEKKAELCPGYFGKIDLALPVFNNHFVGYIDKILKCICFRCSNLLIDKSDPNILKELYGKKGSSRFTACVAICARNKNKKCSYNNGCFVLQPTKYIRLNGAASIKDKNNIIQIIGEFSQSALKDTKVLKQQNFTPLICYQIFKKIKDEDVEFLGLSAKYSRPEWMIITSLACPPPSVRPSVRQSDNQRSEDDLTFALTSIVKVNKTLKQILETNNGNNKKIDDYQGYLQYLVSTYMDNEIPGVDPLLQRSSFRPLKAITQRLKGKEGRLRGNIMGKRVDYSARTVISVDPNIDIDEYGVPQKIAMNLTFPEIVTKYNYKKMQVMIRNGPKVYPGAKTITKTSDGNNRNISLKHVDVQQIADNLEVGDIVHRHLIDGDVCLFNRQPTLHKMSMMAHRIKILPYSTFRLNVFVCKPYNADFDGDEMNMHIPQSWQTFTELEQICLVPHNIISPGTSKPSLEITQDTLIGAYLLTIQDIKLTKDKMNNLMMFSKRYNGYLPEAAGIEYGQPYWTGKQLYSLILPDININQLKTIKIIGGNIIDGYLNTDSLGDNPAGLIKQIYNAYGMEHCNNFLNDTQKLITRWLIDNSFTIGFGDSIITSDKRKTVKEITDKYLQDSFDLIRSAQHGVFANDLNDEYKASKLDFEITQILNNLTEKIKDYLMSTISKDNNFYRAGDKASGSKGKTTNIQQIMGCVGQQSIWGSRIIDGFTERTLPHFHRNDIGPDAKGFCRNSYIEGLSPSEMFFHAMGGRTGTIDTAIKTAQSGYLSRKLIKAAEDLMINYDMTVRNASGYIVQFSYGDDNFDPTKLEKVSRIELIEYDNTKIEEQYKFDTLDDKEYFETFMKPETINEMMENSNYKLLLDDEFNEILEMRNELRYNYFRNVEAIGDINTYIPINLFRVIASQLIKFNVKPFDLTDLTPEYIIKTYNETMKDIIKYLPEKEENWKLYKIIFKSFLSSKRVMKEYRMSKSAFDSIILLIKEKMMGALINPGEMVGIIGSQTLGEISTQLTLNTFHLAGVGAGSLVITESIPRLMEIINTSKNMKNKNMTIYLKDEYTKNKNEARKVQSKIGFTQLKDILAKSEILYDNKYGATDKLEDREFIKSYKEFTELFDIDNINESCLSPWILRLTFDKESLMIRKITVQEIQETIKQNFHNEDEIDCIYSDDSVNDVIMRIRIKQDSKGNFLEFIKDFEKQLIGLSLRGITNVKAVEILESNIIKYNNDGSIEPSKEWMLKTNGSNLLAILSNDSIDTNRTITNDIWEFYDIFGIEATRELIYRELYKIYVDKHPNPRHIQMISDIMTYRGKLMQIDRHGLNKNSEIGPIAKACFEEVMNIFTKASVFAEKDNMKGVSANILAGQFCKSGTNAFDLLIDEDKLLENIEINDFDESTYVNVNEKDIDKAFDNTYNNVENTENIDDKDFTFGFGIEQTTEFNLEKNINTEDKNIIIVNKNNISIESNTKNKFDEINVDIEQNYNNNTKVNVIVNDTVNNGLNINFENINIEEPIYDDNKKEEEKLKIKPKKFKIIKK